MCTSYILTFDRISLLILSDLKMYHAPAKGLTGANYVGFGLVFFSHNFIHVQNLTDSSIISTQLCESNPQLSL